MVSQIENSDWLQWIERLVSGGPTVTARPSGSVPPSRSLYYCCLDDQPDFLVPERYLSSVLEKAPPDCKWVFNPECSFSKPRDVEFPNDFFACGSSLNSNSIIWVWDAFTHSAMPYWLGPRLNESLAGTEPGAELPVGISKDILSVLKAAGIAVEENYSHSHKHRSQTLEYSRQKFQDNGYVPVAQLIHPFHLASLRRYYRHHLRSGHFRCGDMQSGLRYIAHNEPIAKFFHQQLTKQISDLVGEPLKPSYSYFSTYSEGAILEKHQDREQCQFTVSLCIDYSPEPELETPWPLRLHTERGEVLVFQGLGDALLFRGCQIPHSRNRLGNGQSSTSIFFHYVHKDFPGSLD